MLRACPYCQKIHDSKYICSMKPKKFKKNTKIDKFRNSTAWRKKREEIRERDNNLCQACVRNLQETKIKYNSIDLSVHHAISIEDDYNKRLDEDNLLTLCTIHHKLAEKNKISYKTIKKIIDEQNKKQRE